MSGNRDETTIPCKECKTQLKFKANDRMVCCDCLRYRTGLGIESSAAAACCACAVEWLLQQLATPFHQRHICLPRLMYGLPLMQLVVVPKNNDDKGKGKGKEEQKEAKPAAA